MSREGHLDQKARAAQKAATRRRDAEDLAAGRVTREELNRRNGFFGGLDVAAFEIVAVGGKQIAPTPGRKRPSRS